MKQFRLISPVFALLSVLSAGAANNTFDIDLKKTGAPIQSTMYGIFFEDINYAADGGPYAELVKNRSFEFPNALQGWKIFGNVQVLDDGPFERNPHYVQTLEKATLRIFMETRGRASVDLEHISLFPADTWKGREGGLRKDLAQALH